MSEAKDWLAIANAARAKARSVTYTTKLGAVYVYDVPREPDALNRTLTTVYNTMADAIADQRETYPCAEPIPEPEQDWAPWYTQGSP